MASSGQRKISRKRSYSCSGTKTDSQRQVSINLSLHLFLVTSQGQGRGASTVRGPAPTDQGPAWPGPWVTLVYFSLV